MKTVVYPNIGTVTYRKYARSKRLTIRVRKTGVAVSMPMRASYLAAENFVLQQENWILQQLQKVAVRQQANLIDLDSTFSVRGKPLTLTNHSSNKVTLSITAAAIQIAVPSSWDISDPSTQSVLQKAIVEALRAEGKAYLPQRTRRLAQERSISINNIRIKNIKSRWGSCSSKKNINLSVFLMLLPDDLIDYVICHELAHIKHQNHSPAFWQHLEQLLPGAGLLDKQMRQHRMPF